MTAYLGIDPGKTGGLACITTQREVLMDRLPYLPTEVDALELLTIINSWLPLDGTIVLERQWASPNRQATGGPGITSVGTLMEGYGALKAVALLSRRRRVLVTPVAWKQELGLTGQYKTVADRKRASVALARTLYPGLGPELGRDGIAEALLIAEWGRRRNM